MRKATSETTTREHLAFDGVPLLRTGGVEAPRLRQKVVRRLDRSLERWVVADAGTALSLYLTTLRRALRAFKAVPLPNMPNKAAARTTKSANMEHFIVMIMC